MSYNWQEINDRLLKAVKPSCNAVAVKFIKTEEQLDAIKYKRYWRQPDACVCKLINLATYLEAAFVLEAEYAGGHCADMHGFRKREEIFKKGIDLNSDPIKWHGIREDSEAHMLAAECELPTEDHIAIVAAPMYLGAIEDPDCIVISSEPCAAFHVLAGLIEKDWHQINFAFRGESTCAETWDHTYTTGLPGLSLGCRGDICEGGLNRHEVRYSISVEDLLKALEGMDRLASDGITYPYLPNGVVVPSELPTE